MSIRILDILRPNIQKVLVLALLILVTALVVVDREAGSKGTWVQKRGIPFAFLVLVEHRMIPLPFYEYREIRYIELIKNIPIMVCSLMCVSFAL